MKKTLIALLLMHVGFMASFAKVIIFEGTNKTGNVDSHFVFNGNQQLNGGQIVNGGTTLINGETIENWVAKNGIVGSGIVDQLEKQLEQVDSVSADSVITLKIEETNDNDETLLIKAEDNILPHVSATVAGKKLHLSLDLRQSMILKKPIECVVKINNAKKIKLSGCSTAQLKTIKGNDLDLTLEGASRIAGSINANKLSVQSSGATKTSLNGHATFQKLDCSGSCNYDAQDLLTKIAQLRVDGVGKATVNVSERITGSVDGCGNIDYSGNPEKVNIQKSGLGKINGRK